jgi:hypothetical protein
MRHPHRIAVALAFIFTLSSVMAGAAMNTRLRLSKFGDDLREVIQKNISPTRKAVREELVQSMNTQFSNDMRSCPPPPKWTLQKATDAYVGSLEDMYTLFPTEGSRNERNLFMRACADTYKQENKNAVDYTRPRTTQDCYDMLLRNMEAGTKRFAQERCRDARTDMQTAFNSLFSELIGPALVPEEVDMAKQLGDNVDRARQLFPVHTPQLSERNGTIVTLLEAAAKRVEQRAVQAKKLKK